MNTKAKSFIADLQLKEDWELDQKLGRLVGCQFSPPYYCNERVGHNAVAPVRESLTDETGSMSRSLFDDLGRIVLGAVVELAHGGFGPPG